MRIASMFAAHPCADAGREIPYAQSSLQVSPCGNFLHGLPALLGTLPSRKQQGLIHCWFALVVDAMIADNLDSNAQKFVDVLMFVCYGYRAASSSGRHRLRGNARALTRCTLHSLGRRIFQYIARQMSTHICEVYMREHPTDKPALSLWLGRKKKWTTVAP